MHCCPNFFLMFQNPLLFLVQQGLLFHLFDCPDENFTNVFRAANTIFNRLTNFEWLTFWQELSALWHQQETVPVPFNQRHIRSNLHKHKP